MSTGNSQVTTSKFYRHLTASGDGGISSFLLYDQNILKFIRNYFKTFNGKQPTFALNRFFYGKLYNSHNILLDEIILCFKQINILEIHSHGGFRSTHEITNFLVSIEYQKMPNLIFQNIFPFQQYNQALKETTTANEFEFLKKQTANFKSYQTQIENLKNETIENLLQSMIIEWQKEKVYRKRINVCLAGLPNAGKSSLINAITGKKRALVSSIAKTTRDSLTENVQVHGYRLQIMDTAGLHNPDNYLDQESVKQAIANIEKSEVIFWLHDNTLPFSIEEKKNLEIIQKKVIKKPLWLILTKADINTSNENDREFTIFKNIKKVSSITGAGVEAMLADLIQMLFPPRQETLPLAAISEQMTVEISDFLQKVDLLPAKHKMLKEFFSKTLNCIPE